jgi:phosphoesterase RecJ-like protein
MNPDSITVPKFLATYGKEINGIKDLLAKAQNILITTHERPDSDAVGSILALLGALVKMGKSVTTHTPDDAAEFLNYLVGFDKIKHGKLSLAEFDLIIAVDHSGIQRTGLGEEIKASGKPVIAIDHHFTSDRFGTVVLVVPDAAATCEIIAEIILELGIDFDAEIATALLSGIVGDTGSFQHSNVSSHVMQISSKLMEQGANLRAIMRSMYGGRSLSALRITGRALERVQANPKTGAAISIITHQDLEECGATVDDLAGVVNLLNSIPETSFSFLLTEYEVGKLKGSLRSEPEKEVDVSQIAKMFGGGGHKLASGFEVVGTLVKDETGWRIV